MNTMWKSLHEKWRGLPAHIRNGSLRLYLVICALCVVWFGYKILNVFERHSYYGPKWEDVVPLFWALLLVPVGGPILFFAAIWILEGFGLPLYLNARVQCCEWRNRGGELVTIPSAFALGPIS
jgi:hypothetical protein